MNLADLGEVTVLSKGDVVFMWKDGNGEIEDGDCTMKAWLVIPAKEWEDLCQEEGTPAEWLPFYSQESLIPPSPTD